jgi:predicted glutamine amidotransferase
MCRLAGWVSSTPATLRGLLGDAAVDRLLRLSTVHCHGWGAAWHEGDSLRVHRSPVAAHADPGFADFVDGLAATHAIVHLRLGTPGYGRTVVDNHPFSDGTRALIHNGAVAPTGLVDALLPAGARPEGSTDSERWFLALGAELDRGTPIADAVPRVIEHARAAGLHASSWNSLLLAADGVHVINHHDPSWVPVDVQLWPELYPPVTDDWPPYFALRVRATDQTTVVLSSGIVDDVADWTLLPNETVVPLELAGRRSAPAADGRL